MKTSYIVQPTNRREFYNYMHNLGYKDKFFSKEDMINGKFPFHINTLTKEITVIASITCCAAAASRGQILSFEEFVASM